MNKTSFRLERSCLVFQRVLLHVFCHQIGGQTDQLRARPLFVIFRGSGAGNRAALRLAEPQQFAADDAAAAVALLVLFCQGLHLCVGLSLFGPPPKPDAIFSACSSVSPISWAKASATHWLQLYPLKNAS